MGIMRYKRKRESCKEMAQDATKETQSEYRRLKKAAKKAVARAMKE